MADVSEKMVGKTPRQLLSAGARAYATSNYNAAIQYLSRASELTVAETGTHTDDSLGEIYFLYGKSLLELSREEGDPLGDVVPKDIAVAQEAEEEEVEGQAKSGEDEEDSAEDDDSENSDEEGEEGEEEEEEEEEEKEDEEESNEGDEEKAKGKDKEENAEEKVEEASAKGVEFNGESKTAEKSEGKSEEKEEADKDKDDKEKTEESGDDKAEAGASGAKPSEPEEEVASDLQVAWEVLELAKIIFAKRGDEAKPDLAETLITLGEISLESENFESAVNDITEGLAIQKTLYDDTDRTLAETHYKLGMGLSMNNKLDEAIDNFNRSIQLLKNRIEKLKDSQQSLDKREVAEMTQLIPEIEEKIVDLKNYHEELAKKVEQEPRPILPGSPEKKASDISHLVKRKRTSSGDTEGTSSPAKKPALKL